MKTFGTPCIMQNVGYVILSEKELTLAHVQIQLKTLVLYCCIKV